MGSDHRPSATHLKRLVWIVVAVFVFMIVEAVTGLLTGSLALLSEAGHMLTDLIGLSMALAAILAARRTGSARNTFGLYRIEILAALANAVLLFGVAIYVIVESIGRLRDPEPIAVGPVLIVAAIGLVVNIVAWRLLHDGASSSLNLEGAYLEVLADLIGSVGVIIAALVVHFTGWLQADPGVALVIAIYIIPRAISLGRKAVRILLQSAPDGVDVAAVQADLEAVDGVAAVHDIHLWTLTSQMHVGSAHLVVDPDADSHEVLDLAREVLVERHDIDHATLQIEPDDHRNCEEAIW